MPKAEKGKHLIEKRQQELEMIDQINNWL